MTVLVFDMDGFTTDIHDNKRGWPYYDKHCDGRVAVHVTWFNRGYRWPATYSPSTKMTKILDWCSEHAPNGHIIHNRGAVLFKDEQVAAIFKLTWSE